MGVLQYSIELDNTARSYFPGQNVTGKVLIVLEKSKNCQGKPILLKSHSCVLDKYAARKSTNT